MDDVSEVVKIHAQSIGMLPFLTSPYTAEETRAFFATVISEQNVHVATNDNRLVGFIGETQNWINHLWILPEIIGKGIGTALLRDAQRRQSYLQLWCFQKNQRARNFYESRGFAVLEFSDGAGNEEKEPDLLYEWRKS